VRQFAYDDGFFGDAGIFVAPAAEIVGNSSEIVSPSLGQ